MIVKNVNPAGESRYFTFGNKVGGRTLLNNGLCTLPDNDPVVMGFVMTYVSQGIMQIMEGPTQFGRLASANIPAYGYLKATGAITNGDYFTVGGLKFIFGADPGTGVLGTYYASLVGYWAGAGAAQATAMATLRTALVAQKAATGMDVGVLVTSGTDKILPLCAANGSYTGTPFTLVKSGSNSAVSGATLTAGSAGAAKRFVVTTRPVVAADVTNGFIVIALPFIPGYKHVSVRTAAGATKVWDGNVLIGSSNTILTLNNEGTTDFADTDIISLFVVEA